jgi:hypothetical protein
VAFPATAKRGEKVTVKLSTGEMLTMKVPVNWQPGVPFERPVKNPRAGITVASVESCEINGGMSCSAFTMINDYAPLISPPIFRILDAGWNFMLCWLSVVMLFGVIIGVVLRMKENGTFNPWTFFCDEEGWAHDQPENRPGVSLEELRVGDSMISNLRPGPVNFFGFAFCLSKYVELFDTIFHIAKRPRRPVILLHWYHHCTVLLFTWFAGKWATTAGLIFVSMNAAVHSFMYYFYFRGSLGGRISWAKNLTMIQMTQMVGGVAVGISITVKWYIHYYGAKATLPFQQRDTMCRSKQPEIMVLSCIVMYASYLWLFFHMYAQKYYRMSGLELIFGSKTSSSLCGDDPAKLAPLDFDANGKSPTQKHMHNE